MVRSDSVTKTEELWRSLNNSSPGVNSDYTDDKKDPSKGKGIGTP